MSCISIWVLQWRQYSVPRATNIQRIVQLAVAVVMALMVSGLARAAHEMVEEVVHVATQGHSAHGEVHPEGGVAPGTEHDCVGFVHHCGCCSSLVAACSQGSLVVDQARPRGLAMPRDETCTALGTHDRVDRPPRV